MILDKLALVQQELKVPKAQNNTFGNYKYRSCEDILDHVKPLLLKHEMTMVISDDVVMIGERYYIRASVTIYYKEEFHTVTAFAREEENKKGMDSSQVSGACSSYARKYALNGLFLIDDTKDSDATNNGKEVTKPSPASKPVSTVKVTMKPVEGDIVGQFISKVTEQKFSAAKKKNYNQTKYYVCTDGVDTFENITCFKDIDCKANDNLKFTGIKQWTRGEEVNFSAEKVEIIKEEIPFGEMDDIE